MNETPMNPSDRTPEAGPKPEQNAPVQRVKLPAAPAGRRAPEVPGMLPGMAMIAMFMLVVALLNVFAAWRGAYGYGGVRTAALAVCTLFVIGVFGFLRLRKWGLALLLGGTLCLSAGYTFLFIRTHRPGMLIPALFTLVFFFYLVRGDVRDRVS